MDSTSDDEKFILVLPIWTVINLEQKDHPFIEIVGDNGLTGSPLFTDDDLAQRYLSSNPGFREYRVVGMRTPLEFLEGLQLFVKKGINNVVIDPTINRGQFQPIRSVVDAILAAVARAREQGS